MADERNPVFGLAPPLQTDQPATVIVGVSRACWQWIRKSRTVNFDLSAAGLPVQFVIFGAPSQADCRDLIQRVASADGQRAVLHDRMTDFTVNDVSEAALDAGEKMMRERSINITRPDLMVIFRAMRTADDDAAMNRLEGR